MCFHIKLLSKLLPKPVHPVLCLGFACMTVRACYHAFPSHIKTTKSTYFSKILAALQGCSSAAF